MNPIRSALALACLSGCGVAAAGSVHHVPADFPTIQAAIDGSSDGDTILVDPGTYFEAIDITHDVGLRSTGGAAVTVIDALYLGPVVTTHSSATAATRVEGFTITHGRNDFWAGGIAVNGGSPWIVANIVTENLGGGFGNGISLYFSSARVQRNEVTHNSNNPGISGGGGGGGIGVGGDPCPGLNCGTEIRGNLIAWNSAASYTTGGGIYLNAAGSVAIVDNEIRGNSTQSEGGGIGMYNGSSPRIEGNLIVGNVVSGQGGGIYWLTPSGERGAFAINNTIVGNHATQGSGIYADGYDVAARIINNVVVAEPGWTGIECGTFNDPFPPIVRDNDVFATGAAAFADLCAGQEGTNGNLTSAPHFVGADDYRLARGSPGIDAGENAFVSEATDLRGRPRILDGNGDGTAIVDLGAYEFVRPALSAPHARAKGR